mmetsp:Transcript_3862/g.9603  ORF Transcript_3862/g.9603 Transcript_3862/m.9603 type:complete len:119 (-) Transcript_3862:606-962(-)
MDEHSRERVRQELAERKIWTPVAVNLPLGVDEQGDPVPVNIIPYGGDSQPGSQEEPDLNLNPTTDEGRKCLTNAMQARCRKAGFTMTSKKIGHNGELVLTCTRGKKFYDRRTYNKASQ